MSREVLHDFDDGHGLTDSQRNTLGIWVPDPSNGDWCYGQFYGNGVYNTGCLVRHADSNDLPRRRYWRNSHGSYTRRRNLFSRYR